MAGHQIRKPISSKFVMPQFTPLHWNLSPCFTDWYTPLMSLKKGHKPCTSSVKIIIIRHTTQGECTQMNDGQHSGSRGNGQNKKSRTFQAFKKSLKHEGDLNWSTISKDSYDATKKWAKTDNMHHVQKKWRTGPSFGTKFWG